MAKEKRGLGRAISFAVGAAIAALALINAYKAMKRAYRAVKKVGAK